MRNKKEYHIRDRQINIKYLCLAVVKKWRSILGFAIVGMLLVPMANFLVQNNQEHVVLSTVQEQYEELEDNEREEIDYYLKLRKNSEEQKEYFLSSAFYQLDPDNVYKVIMQYNIVPASSEDEDEYLVNTLYSIYSQYVDERVLLDNEKIRKIKMFEDIRDINQLISKADGNSVGVKKESDTVIAILIRFATEEGSKELARQVDAQIQGISKTLQTSVGQHSIVLINEITQSGSEEGLADVRNSRQAGIMSIESQVDRIKSTLSEKQLDIIEGLTEDNSETLQEETPAMVPISRYVIVGAVLGLFIACLLAVFGYMFAAKLNYAKEMEEIFEIDVMGILGCKQYKGIFRKLDYMINNKLFAGKDNMSNDDKMTYLGTELKLKCSKKDIKQIGILSTNIAIQSENVAIKLQAQLNKENINVVSISGIDKDATELTKIVEVDAIVVLEKVGESLYKMIEKQNSICDEFNVNVLGAIVLQ